MTEQDVHKMREIVLDTETTGLDPDAGHRVVEIAALELLGHIPTGRSFQCYLNPERDMPEDAERVHGLSEQFLSDKPKFEEMVQEFLEFIGDANLIIHNAAFDLKFLNAELKAIGQDPISANRAIDTVQLARQKLPGAQVSLDALCRRFQIDNSARTFHGALLDCELLSEVYLELRGGRQPDLALAANTVKKSQSETQDSKPERPARPHFPSETEADAHAKMLEGLKSPIWLN
ncbi:MAG: DNA polymerase III subunit epsilon [Kiloniellales bacterium]|nr:DNA polymerase III subunit epsilon [Kiloniellales bacterium]